MAGTMNEDVPCVKMKVQTNVEAKGTGKDGGRQSTLRKALNQREHGTRGSELLKSPAIELAGR